MPYFPFIDDIYEDEMLYSYFLRLAQYNHYTFRTLNTEVFGYNYATKLNVFLKGLDPEILEEILGDDWLNKYLELSMIGPILPFVTHYGRVCLFKHIFYPKMIWDESVCVSYVVRYNTNIRLCEKCYEEQINEHKEWMLRLSHNAFSPVVCKDHKIPLKYRKLNVIDMDKVMNSETYSSVEELNKTIDIDFELKYSNFINSYISSLKYDHGKIILQNNKFIEQYTDDEIREFITKMQTNVLGFNKESLDKVFELFTQNIENPIVLIDINKLISDMEELKEVQVKINEYSKSLSEGNDNIDLKKEIISILNNYSFDVEEIHDLKIHTDYPPTVLIYNNKVGYYMNFKLSYYLQLRMAKNCIDIVDVKEMIDNNFIGYDQVNNEYNLHCNKCNKSLKLPTKCKVHTPDYCDKCKKNIKKYNWYRIYED
ncbi:TniQ family protein [Anaerococcus sp.]|uniref:TniQ family protein n=1 Tax=Anaerococcus sp. TaxID=1872515 RepID=UPI00280AC7AF|nr:TniQ family protein [Anaerococcus sp.]MDU3176685.1 TniQ family protein [Anaerococcus sp.]